MPIGPRHPNATWTGGLAWSAIHGGPDDVGILVRRRADLDPDARIEGRRGRTALMETAHAGLADMTAWLLAHGARATLADDHGMTALHHAAGRGHGRIIDLLIAAGADPDAPDALRKTALHHAFCADDGFAALGVQPLLEAGASFPSLAPDAGGARIGYDASMGWHACAAIADAVRPSACGPGAAMAARRAHVLAWAIAQELTETEDRTRLICADAPRGREPGDPAPVPHADDRGWASAGAALHVHRPWGMRLLAACG